MEHKILMFLQKDKTTTIIPADEDYATVIMDYNFCNRKIS